MAITVRRLITALKKMPPDAYVAWQNHDQNSEEIDGFVGHADLADPIFYEAAENATQTAWLGKRRVVVLRS